MKHLPDDCESAQEPQLPQNDLPASASNSNQPASFCERLKHASVGEPDKAALAEKKLNDSLKEITQAIKTAKQNGASQDALAEAVLDGMGIIFGDNPFTKRSGKGMGGWGEGIGRSGGWDR